MQVEILCPRCSKVTKYALIPEPIVNNVVMIQERTTGVIANWENKDGIWVCMGCMKDYGLEFLEENGDA